jgi:putative endonuclease
VKSWVVYILECADGTFYTGITNDMDKRLKAHIEGKGAKYTRGRGPFIVRFLCRLNSKSQALKKEIEIKKKNRKQKEEIIAKYGEEKRADSY